jgi:hypothetical protein
MLRINSHPARISAKIERLRYAARAALAVQQASQKIDFPN